MIDFSEVARAMRLAGPHGAALVDDVALAVGNEEVRAYFARPETAFDDDAVYERAVVFVLTATRLVVLFSDISHDFTAKGELVSDIQVISLDQVREHHVIRRREVDGDDFGQLNSAVLRLRWGGSWSTEILPSMCEDPQCTLDHGFIGMLTNDDFQIFTERFSDGEYFAPTLAFMGEVEAALGGGR
ncbi:hypothetical protein J2S49_000236 [Arcanobacterium wilhelmae]|uniref:Uncharacterized protein n=1 Tax=Arcanobacterium wilhelmae TaxID=1803177 RepID=A0ABT9N9G5_9ACTO|nr:DUF5998 family protein [Arcanobacterium wilhelmae]MDP9800160.1 hypothetical protein [Arcanobacterium wilhelmae]WFN89600.1 DUF5998 family protein [Arcanobacterium wilhelmae]